MKTAKIDKIYMKDKWTILLKTMPFSIAFPHRTLAYRYMLKHSQIHVRTFIAAMFIKAKILEIMD